jgi:hypothetical protein
MLPIPLGLACGTLNLTVLEDEFRMSSFSRVAYAQSRAGKSDVTPTPAVSAGM